MKYFVAESLDQAAQCALPQSDSSLYWAHEAFIDAMLAK